MSRHSSRDRSNRRNNSSNSSSDRDGRSKKSNYVNVLADLCKELSASREQWVTNQHSQQQKTNICPGDQCLIPFFDPSKSNITIVQWINNVDDIAKKFGWEDCSILRLIVSRLKGPAKKWFATRNGIATWTETKKEMLKIFSCPFPFAKLQKEAVLYEAQPGKNLGEYCLEKITKWKKLNITIPDEYIIDMIIDSIKDKNIGRIIRTAKFTKVTDLHNYMKTLGPMPGRKRRREGVEMKKTNAMDNVTGTKVKCYNCGEEGHFSKKCQRRSIGWKHRIVRNFPVEKENYSQKYNNFK